MGTDVQVIFSRVKEILKELDRITILFVLLALTFGVFFALTIPLGYTDDEYAHVPKAYSVSTGQFFASFLGSSSVGDQKIEYYGGYIPVSIYNLESLAVSQGVANDRCNPLKSEPICGRQSHSLQQKINLLSDNSLNPGKTKSMDFGGAGSYIFIPYIPAAIGIDTGRILGLNVESIIKLGRIYSLLAYILIVALGLFLLRKSRSKWVIFSVALLPQSLVMSASIGVDMLLNALSLLLFTITVLAMKQKANLPKALKISLILTAMLLPIIKLPYLVLSLSVLLLPIYPRAAIGYAWRVCVAALIIIPTILYITGSVNMTSSQSLMMHFGDTAPNTLSQLSFISGHPFQYLEIFLNSLIEKDWFTSLAIVTHQHVPLPTITLLASVTMLSIAGIFAGTSLKKYRIKSGILLLCSGLIAIVGIGTGLYAAYTPVGFNLIQGVQGRYLIPCIPYVILGLGILVGCEIKSSKVGKYAYITLHILTLFISALFYYKTIYL